MSNMVGTRLNVLKLYKNLLKTGKDWKKISPHCSDLDKESSYIINETKRLFRQNQNITDEKEIADAIKEGESRLELAIHYKNPWPRPTHIPQKMLPPSDRRKQKSDRFLSQSKPAYLKSYDIGDKDKE